MAKIDKRDFQKRLDRLTEIFSGMVGRADDLSQTRCPYRDRHDHCTAEFRCRNQKRGENEADPIICQHDGQFDYRVAWETDPASYDRAKKKINAIKDDAAEQRRRGRRKSSE